MVKKGYNTFILVLLFFGILMNIYGISVTAKKTDIRDVLRLISQQSGINIIPDASVKGNIDVNIKDLSLEDALKAILEPNGYIYKKRGSVYLISIPRRKGGRLQIITDGKTLTCDLKNADIKDVLKEVADQAKIDIVVYGNLIGTVDATLTAVKFEDALNYLLGGTKYSMKKTSDGIYLVGDPSPQSPSAPMLSASEMIRLKYLKAEDLPDIIKTFSPNLNVKVIKEENGVIVMGSQKEIMKAKEYIEKIDKKSPIVSIDVITVEYKKGYKNLQDFSLSGAYGQFTNANMQPGSTSSQQGGFFSAAFDESTWDMGKFTANLRYLINQNKAKIVANPHISALSGYPASISVGQDEYYEVTTGNVDTPLTSLQKIQTGVILNITPWITASNEIILQLAPEVSDFVQTSGSGKAATSKKSANTTIRVKDGQMIVIGGLTKRTESKAKDKIPLLGDIPIIGNLFSQKTKTDDSSELVFYIIPRIMKENKNETLAKLVKPLIDWGDLRKTENNKFLKSGIKKLIWSGVFAGTGLYLNKLGRDFDDNYNISNSESDKINAKYYGIAGNSAYILSGIEFSFSLYDFGNYI